MIVTVFISRMALAFILGAIIGIERQIRQKSAGLRTNTLVCIGAAGFVLMSYHIDEEAVGRVASYVVSGIGFLGAGVIMKDGFNIRGLNTAATIWCSAAVGLMCGVGLWMEAIVMAFLIILTHYLLRPISLYMNKLSFEHDMDTSETHYEIVLGCKEEVENKMRIQTMKLVREQKDFQMKSIKNFDQDFSSYAYLKFEIYAVGKRDEVVEEMAQKLSLQVGVTEVSWEVITY